MMRLILGGLLLCNLVLRTAGRTAGRTGDDGEVSAQAFTPNEFRALYELMVQYKYGRAENCPLVIKYDAEPIEDGQDLIIRHRDMKIGNNGLENCTDVGEQRVTIPSTLRGDRLVEFSESTNGNVDKRTVFEGLMRELDGRKWYVSTQDSSRTCGPNDRKWFERSETFFYFDESETIRLTVVAKVTGGQPKLLSLPLVGNIRYMIAVTSGTTCIYRVQTDVANVILGTARPSDSPSVSPIPSDSAAPSASASASASIPVASSTPSASSNVIESSSPSSSASLSASVGQTSSSTASPSVSATSLPSVAVSTTPSASMSSILSASMSSTPSASMSSILSASMSSTPSASMASSASASMASSASASMSSTPSTSVINMSPTPSGNMASSAPPTQSSAPSMSMSSSPQASATSSATPTWSPSATATSSLTPTPTRAPTRSPELSLTVTQSLPPTRTPTPSSTPSSTASSTPPASETSSSPLVPSSSSSSSASSSASSSPTTTSQTSISTPSATSSLRPSPSGEPLLAVPTTISSAIPFRSPASTVAASTPGSQNGFLGTATPSTTSSSQIIPLGSATPSASVTTSPTFGIAPGNLGSSDRNTSTIDGTSTCFPASAKVVEMTRGTIRISSLRVGDSVWTGTEFSSVMLFTHEKVDADTVFRRVCTKERCVVVSHGHYMYANGGLMQAGSVGIGDMTNAGYVVSVDDIREKGLYNPQTENGDLVVDGFHVSCYTERVEFCTAHALLAPVRVLARFVPIVGKWVGERVGRVADEGWLGLVTG